MKGPKALPSTMKLPRKNESLEGLDLRRRAKSTRSYEIKHRVLHPKGLRVVEEVTADTTKTANTTKTTTATTTTTTTTTATIIETLTTTATATITAALTRTDAITTIN